MPVSPPKALRFGRARHFQQDRKLQRLSILCLVEDDTKAFLANSWGSDRMLQQLFRERDLIVVSHHSVIQSKIAIITLHLCGDARGGSANPFSQRYKFFLPELGKLCICRRKTNRPAQIFPIPAETLFPFAKFSLRFRDVVAAGLIYLLVNVSEIGRWTWCQPRHLQNSRARASA